ncbi:hypothetical protein O59_003289 [Cellvibrio sp. BR]|nr:hypothetical protein O59_003289 [Cellvibrio sp. BR]
MPTGLGIAVALEKLIQALLSNKLAIPVMKALRNILFPFVYCSDYLAIVIV